jgi:hypothetical protein
MLDVCDELGLMVVSETPIRGSEGLEDCQAGRDHMVAAARELVVRDRRHPSVVMWSAANELWPSLTTSLYPALQGVMLEADSTRPVIFDGVGDIGPGFINMEHYVGGLGSLPEIGGTPRTDRPYGETECVWPMDNTWQGFAWMATCTRLRRLKNNADIRNYVLNNAWSNYVPGQRPALQHLELKIKRMNARRWTHPRVILPPIKNPWVNPHIRLMQQCFHPTAACDVEFDRANRASDRQGRWPVVAPSLVAGRRAYRMIAVFNDEFADPGVTVQWELRYAGGRGGRVAAGRFCLLVPCGEFRTREIQFDAPERRGTLRLVLRVFKGGRLRFKEDRLLFRVMAPPA